MMLVERAAIVAEDASDLLAQARTTLVRVPHGVSAELFGGWGVRI